MLGTQEFNLLNSNLLFEYKNTKNTDLKTKKNKFNVEKQMNCLRELNGKFLVRTLCNIFKEERVVIFVIYQRDILERIFEKTGKDLFLSLAEKTMLLQNEGGVPRGDQNREELKTSGGVFMGLVKKEGSLNKRKSKKCFICLPNTGRKKGK